jgi:hypothetical protein
MDIIKFNDELLIEMLLENIPEFKKNVISEFIFSSYLVFGDFGLFLTEEILNRVKNFDLIERAFNLLNRLGNDGDEKVIQMLRVTTFEILTDDNETIGTAMKYLKGNTLKIFLEVVVFIKG